jgi:hypothetical protein
MTVLLLASLADGRLPAWAATGAAATLLGYSWTMLLGAASSRPRLLQGRHRRRTA